jgi:DNA-binding transcriptional ArsR family regulator
MLNNRYVVYSAAMSAGRVARRTTDASLDGAFAALGDPTRRAIVARLARGEATVGELAAPFDLTPQAVSRHIGVLRSCGLIDQRVDGARRPCRLNGDRMAELADWIAEQRRQWHDRLDRLEEHLGAAGGAAR